MVEVVFDAPDFLDAEALRQIVQEFAEREVARWSEFARVLTSDAALREYEKKIGVPLVRAYCYTRLYTSSDNWRYIRGFPSDDPRRPVVMRGAREALIRKYCGSHNADNPIGWAKRVAKRYFRMTKYTCFDSEKYHEDVRKLEIRMERRRYAPSGNSRIDDFLRVNRREAWLMGKNIYLTEHQRQYLERLWTIKCKTERLIKRAA